VKKLRDRHRPHPHSKPIFLKFYIHIHSRSFSALGRSEVPTQRDRPSQSHHTVGEFPPHCDGCVRHTVREPPHSVMENPHTVRENRPHCEGFPPHYTSQCDVQCDTLTWSVTLGWYLRPSYCTESSVKRHRVSRDTHVTHGLRTVGCLGPKVFCVLCMYTQQHY
jgi:hypothetical protein